jgi:hypothetical protein
VPFKQLRSGAGGRPRPSLRRLASGNNAPINSHSSSANSGCFLFLIEAQQFIRLTDKHLL